MVPPFVLLLQNKTKKTIGKAATRIGENEAKTRVPAENKSREKMSK